MNPALAEIRRYDSAVISRGKREELTHCAIQGRDVEIVEAVHRHKFLTAHQVLQLWWPGCSGDG